MSSAKPLDGKRYLIFVDELYEDLELWYPKLRLTEAGARVTIAGPEEGKRYSGKHGYPAVAERRIADVKEGDFDGVICPGGYAPDKLRRDPKVLELVRQFHNHGKLVAAICHGGWVPISAGVYKGVTVTGSPAIRDDLVNAGATWKDDSVVVDRHFVCSRGPDDLPDFCRAIIELATA